MAPRLYSRQIIVGDDPNDNIDWWYSNTAYIIKWVVVAVIFFVVLFFLLGGRWHANRRMKKGLPPLAYHRWLLTRYQREQFARQQGHIPPGGSYGYYRGPNNPYGPTYPMQPWGHAPPAYQEPDYVPPYAPPDGASKINPDQNYVPPPGPPPAAVLGRSNAQGSVLTQREMDNDTADMSRPNSNLYNPATPAGPSRTFSEDASHEERDVEKSNGSKYSRFKLGKKK